ncbi:hypothetical protein [Candidatus Phytoplasma pruni]|uniref:Uncharacterized protein n=1 Tax=Candidatus Phytoplasma pruni TaxID=479893 RepID=A0A851HIA3_9MOLU|nr:hypothetical protein [Candidatus Phytoplasma pruni]NWN45553.1 hypothetical protein [Candidatus Phytoplasma pruni]
MNLKKLIKSRPFIISTLLTSLMLLSLFIWCVLIHRITIEKPIKETLTKGEQKLSDEKDYLKALHQWKDQCDFKPHTKYTANEVREKLGRSDGKIYTNSQDYKGIVLKGIIIDDEIKPSADGSIQYKYKKGWFLDDWYFNDILVGTTDDAFLQSIYSYGYYSNTPPPQPPTTVSS